MSITSANAVFFISVSGLFATPQQLQGFAADDVQDTEAVTPTEVLMGVDGIMSAGFVFVPFKQNIMLQADSASNALFDAWYATQQAARDIVNAAGVINYPSIGMTYVLTNGVLSSYPPLADAKKVLNSRKYSITWQSVLGAPLG